MLKPKTKYLKVSATVYDIEEDILQALKDMLQKPKYLASHFKIKRNLEFNYVLD